MDLQLMPDDILVAILYCLPERGNMRKFTADRERLHRAFYGLRDTFPELLADFRFRNRDGNMECDALDQALSNLEASGLLRRQNDTPKYYIVQEGLIRAFTKFVRPILSAKAVDEDDVSKACEQLSAAIG